MTRPYHALRHGEFRRVWVSQLVSQVGSQMQSVALHWHIYLLTGSPLALGAVGLTRALPTVLFSLWGGVLADRRDRRLVMLAAQSGMTVVALALFGLTLSGRETLPALYLLNALGAAAGALFFIGAAARRDRGGPFGLALRLGRDGRDGVDRLRRTDDHGGRCRRRFDGSGDPRLQVCAGLREVTTVRAVQAQAGRSTRPAAKSFTSTRPATKPPMCARYATPEVSGVLANEPAPFSSWIRIQKPSM